MAAPCRLLPEAAVAQPPLQRLGTIEKSELQEDRLYSHPLAFDASLKPGDIIWIGLDSTNPLEKLNHNLIISGDISSRPGGPPPILIAASREELSRTVHGHSLLQSLNRRFYAPENAAHVPSYEIPIPHWVNPLRTAGKLEALTALQMALDQQLAKLPETRLTVPDRFKGFLSSVKPTNETWEIWFPVRSKQSSVALYPRRPLERRKH